MITVLVFNLFDSNGITVQTHGIRSTPDGRLQCMEADGSVWCEFAAGTWWYWKAVNGDGQASGTNADKATKSD